MTPWCVKYIEAETKTADSQVYGAQKTSKIVLWVAVGVACFFGVLALVLLTAPWWDRRQGRSDPEAGAADNGQQEPLLAPSTPGYAAEDE